MKPTIKHLCGCRDPKTTKAYPYGQCPRLSQRGHGFWEWRVYVPKELQTLVSKKELKGREPSKTAAEKAADEAIGTVRAGQRHAGGLTVRTYLAEQWLPSKRKLRPSTRARYEQFIRLYLVPYLGDLPLAGLQSHHIDTMFRRIEETNPTRRNPVGPATLGDIRDMLRAALNHALRQRMIPFNPAVAVELPEHTSPEVEPWEAEEVGVFLDEAAGERLFALYELAALHGLRRGELCGLTWPDLDVLTGVLRIRQQITRTGKETSVGPPKTSGSKSKVDVDAGTADSLLAWKILQKQERTDVGPAWDNGVLPNEHGVPTQLCDLIFTRPDGRHLDPEYVTRHMQVIAKRAGLLGVVKIAAAIGATEVAIGNLYREAAGDWNVYVGRERLGHTVRVVGAHRVGGRYVLTLAEPLPVALEAGAELGRGLLPRRRLHDLRHGSASIQLTAGLDITIASKRLRHSSPAITGKIYAHMLRSTGQAAAEAVAAAIPRRARVAQPSPSERPAGSRVVRPAGVVPGQGTKKPGTRPGFSVEVAGIEPCQ